MLGSEAVKCEIFDRINGTASKKLPHPTSSDWDVAEWNAYIDAGMETSDRNFSLAFGGLIIGANLQRLRKGVFPGLFRGLSKLQIASFAIADANRAWSILREKSSEAQRQQAAQTDAVYSGLIGRLKSIPDPMPHLVGSMPLT